MTTTAAVIDDASLLRRYATRQDASAFTELVRRYADLVYATARRVTGSAAAAEDVAQDCFLALATHSAGVRGSVAAWLHRASLNRSLEILRSEGARRQREASAAAAAAAAATAAMGGPAVASASAELIAHVDEAIAALPDELRVAVTEHFLCGRSQAELAQQLGVNPSTISRRIESGLQRLRRRLSARGVTGVASLAMPVLLAQLVQAEHAVAPAGVHAALTKIGLAGIRGSGAAGGAGALTKAAAALLFLLLGAGGILALAFWQTPATNRPTRQIVVSPATTTAATDEEEEDDDDDEDDEDEDDDPKPR